MLDSQKILLIVSYLLRYPDQQWRSEFPSWKWEAENSVQHQLLRESLIEFFEYVEETGLIDFENQYVESFDFSKNTTLYMSTYELQGNGEQSEQLVQFSADFLEKKQLRIGNPLFHLGLLMVIGGHVVGVLVPKICTEYFGINEHMYHQGALWMGVPAGIILLLGFIILMRRRFTVSYMKANTSTMDRWLYLFLAIAIVAGLASTLWNAPGQFDYRESIGPWFRGLLYWNPEPSLMDNVPILFKIHMVSWMIVAILFPFTRLVHCLSLPFQYLTRANIVYRRRDQ